MTRACRSEMLSEKPSCVGEGGDSPVLLCDSGTGPGVPRHRSQLSLVGTLAFEQGVRLPGQGSNTLVGEPGMAGRSPKSGLNRGRALTEYRR